MSLQSVLLQVDKFREEAEEEKIYMDWVEEMSEWKDLRSIWNSIGGIFGGFIGSMFGNPAAGYLAGSTIVGGADYLLRPDAPEAVELGGKFVTQGEREAERVMEAEQPDFMDFLNQNFANIVIRENGTTDLTYTRFLGSGTGNMSMLTETTAYVNDVADYFEIYLYNSVACEVRSASGAYSYFGGYKLIGT